MRILIPSPCYEDSFADNVRDTLVDMGHEVRTLGEIQFHKYWSRHRLLARLLVGRLSGTKPTPEDYKVLRIAREFKPDLILSTTTTLHPLILDELGVVSSRRRALWWGDSAANNRRWGLLDPSWDAVFVKDRAAAQKLELLGRNVHLLYEAMNPKWHKPVAERRNGAVVVVGNYYAFRQAIIVRLIEDGVVMKLYGSNPPVWAHPKISEIHTGRYVVREEKSRIFGEGAAILNTFDFSDCDALNCRAFEVAGAGGLQLIEYRPAIEECFVPGQELLVFKSYEELIELIRRVEKYPAEMESIRRAGAGRALAEHTYRHRLEVILDKF